MRLIDVDDLLNSIYVDNPRDLMEYIANFPTVDAEPVKRGKWIGNYCPYRCDQCGSYSDSKVNFCSYCGSDMREET